MRAEIREHWDRLKEISKLSEYELREARSRLFGKIKFIDEKLISPETWLNAERLVKDIDEDDVDFIALTNHLNGVLWTNDMELSRGLKKKNFKRVFTTREMLEFRKKKTGK